jgi:hypothetical protein
MGYVFFGLAAVVALIATVKGEFKKDSSLAWLAIVLVLFGVLA